MIELHIDIETERDFDLDRSIPKEMFNDFDMFLFGLLLTLDPLESKKVFVLAYGGDKDGIVFVDHRSVNIVRNIVTQFRDDYEAAIMDDCQTVRQVFIFAETNYNDAYKLATDMKESTGMLDFQVNAQEEKEEPTVKNGGIDVTSLKN